jgi:hypothetical protein
MQNQPRHRSRFLYRLSIAIVSGVAAFNAKSAPAREHITLSLGAYTVYQSGVSDQVPVTVKLNWTTSDTIDLTYTAYDSSVPPNQVLNSSKKVQLSNGQTFNDTVVVPTGPTLPIHFYAEAQGEQGQDDEMQPETLSNFTCPPPHAATAGPGPFNIGTPTGIDRYKVRVGAISTQQQNLRLDYSSPTAGITITPPTYDNISLTPDVLWNRDVEVKLGNATPPISFYLTNHADATQTIHYTLGTPPLANDFGPLTLSAGPTLGVGAATVPIANQITLDAQHDPTHAHHNMRVYFSAHDQAGHDYECTPAYQTNLNYTPPQGGAAYGTWDGAASVKVTVDGKEVQGPATGKWQGPIIFTAVLALYDNNAGNPPPSFILPASTITFGGLSSQP